MTTSILFNASLSLPQTEVAKNRFEQISFPRKCLNAAQSGAQNVATALKTALVFLALIPVNVFTFVAGAIKNGSSAVLNTVSNFFRGRHVEVSLKPDGDETALAVAADEPAPAVEEVILPFFAQQEEPVSAASSIQSEVYSEFDGEIEVGFEHFVAEVAVEDTDSTDQVEEAVEVEARGEINTWVATGAAVATVAAVVGIAHFTGYINLTNNALVNNVRKWNSPAPAKAPVQPNTLVNGLNWITRGYFSNFAPQFMGGNPAV